MNITHNTNANNFNVSIENFCIDPSNCALVPFNEETGSDFLANAALIWNTALPYITKTFNFLKLATKESVACPASFLPEDYQITSSNWGKHCAPIAHNAKETLHNATESISKVTDHFTAPMKKIFTTVFSFHSLPKLPSGIAEKPTSNSLAATALLSTALVASVTLPFLSLFYKLPSTTAQQSHLQRISYSGIKGSLIGSGASYLFGQNPIIGASLGAVSMAVMDGISYGTSTIRSWGARALFGMGIMNCAHIVHQDFVDNDRDLEKFSLSFVTGDSWAKVQSEQSKITSLSWKLFGMSFLPYSATAYLSLAAQSPTWRTDTFDMLNNTARQLPNMFNRTIEFAQSPSLDSLNICAHIKPITPKALSYVPNWCSNSYTFLRNMGTEAEPLWNNTISFLQKALATNNTNSTT